MQCRSGTGDRLYRRQEYHGIKTAVVTGASSGIGLVVARELARDGWRVIAQGRHPARCEAALAEIRSAAPGAQVNMLRADLSIMDKVDAFASQVAASTDRIDLLVNNAGATPSRRVETADGFEQTFAANHLAVFLLTDRLLLLLKAAAPGSHVVTTASVAFKFIKDMKWDDLQQVQSFSASDAYTQSKLANILFTREMAKRVKHACIPASCKPTSTVTAILRQADVFLRKTVLADA
ncbi:SDR family NAD(P)-dependent oxidoreductase [Croceicoccus sp. Ery5]|uniref:SDR family NAD(P)-dependent oxidoreductase n=1 Tax=Croceicoccus sp. Ery5 TaxID=1703340 RepID=UPI001E297703|nr:SDR family NAD(P)-dependent oxidoreductase [Croceicoccus sp. Ery5]